MDAAELELLRGSLADHSRRVRLVVHGSSYSCCGRGWVRRDGYEQEYHGYVGVLREESDAEFWLYSAGVGTISYVVAVRFDEVELVEAI